MRQLRVNTVRINLRHLMHQMLKATFGLYDLTKLLEQKLLMNMKECTGIEAHVKI